ncbi:MAG: GNAT family N-acetyltransferase, partial [Desulfovibrionaceae bacterium]|nr:GNAT family N-acetyltransferase [Desulfovibrionaceae bacterium]
MFRIRRIYDDTLPLDRQAIAAAQAILREQFQLLSSEEIEALPDLLGDPVAHGFRTILFVADARGKIQGFALLMHFPDLRFCYLDFLSVPKAMTSRGTGGVLYERVRQEARDLKSPGLFFECLPDDPALCEDPAVLAANRARLRFYERYGARPVVGTAY